MSRRHAPTLSAPPLTRAVGAALVVLLALAALLPAAAAAQNGKITAKDIQWEWQLLTQRDASGTMEDVPAGVGATMLLRAGTASGVGACSSYDSSYSSSDNVLSVFIAPEEIEWRECDPTSRAFDDVFYANLAEISSISRADSVLVVRDAIGENLMVFTRATIDNDPTVSRWNLARIGEADGSVEPVIQGLDPWMEFLRGGSVVGSTGCGSFLGKYGTNEGRIDITDVDHRLIACTEGAQMQAERIIATLDEITDFTVRPAGLALEDELGTTRLALTPELDLAKRTWTPTAIYDGNGRQIRPSADRENELTTSAVKFIGGKLEGHTICRHFTGNALRSGLAVSVGSIEFFTDPCVSKAGGVPIEQIEDDFITALEEASSYALRGSELALIDVNGIARAILEPQPPLTGTTWVVSRMRQGKKMVTPSGDAPITATFEVIDNTQVGVLEGKTGVVDRTGENEYYGNFSTPAAARIDVGALEVFGKACRGTKASNAACKRQERFLKQLQVADGYIARDEDLKFYRGRQNTIVFQRERLNLSEE